ncbi:MAG: RNA polymerase sigma factor SigZ [Desulfobulbaceae bacterium]|nr:RNA polymerase sigma factor SigZ [Desulfobulbaceae bacterium]
MADDISQEVFIKIHSRIDSLKEGTKLENRLFQITRNTIIDHYRSKKPDEALPEWIAQPLPDDEEIIRGELSVCLDPMIKELPDKYREAIRLSEIERKTQKEVAELEGISLSGAKSRVQRGRSLLKTILHECCEIEVNQKNQLIDYQKRSKDCTC